MRDITQRGLSYGASRLNTTRSYRIARLYKKCCTNLQIQEFRYLLNMFHVVQNQFNSYIAALPDDMRYVICPLSSDTSNRQLMLVI